MTTSIALPVPGVIVLIGASGSGKTTLASAWQPDERLELDAYRELVSGDAGDQEATDDAVFVLHAVLEARLARAKTCVVDATNTRPDVRRRLVDAAHAYDLPAVALVMTTSLEQCLARNALRPANRRVPDDVVRYQYEQVAAVRPALYNEDFDQVVTADQLFRPQPLLQRAADLEGGVALL